MNAEAQNSLPEKMKSKLEHIFIFTLTQITHVLSKKANRELIQSGFSLQLEQLPVLFAAYLAGNDLPSQQEIADGLQRDKSGIQRTIRTLERDGYLRVVADKADRRKNLIQLTPAGKLAVERVIQTAEGIDKQITNQLTEEELTSFVITLRKIASFLVN